MYLLYILMVFEILLYYEIISVTRNASAVTIMHKDNLWVCYKVKTGSMGIRMEAEEVEGRFYVLMQMVKLWYEI